MADTAVDPIKPAASMLQGRPAISAQGVLLGVATLLLLLLVGYHCSGCCSVRSACPAR